MIKIPVEHMNERYGLAAEFDKHLGKVARMCNVNSMDTWICGGSVRRHIQGIKQDSDFDVFVKNEATYSQRKEHLKSQAKSHKENSFNDTFFIDDYKIQLIKIYGETPFDVIDKFDFSLCKCATDGESFFFGDYTLFDIANKKLVPEKISYAASTVRRIIKYTNQGYTICGGGIAHILQSVVNNPAIINQETLYLD